MSASTASRLSMEVLARTFFDSDPSGNSKRGGIQAEASRSGFDLDVYRTLPCSESTNAAGSRFPAKSARSGLVPSDGSIATLFYRVSDVRRQRSVRLSGLGKYESCLSISFQRTDQ
jgi:hypothetical protein